MDIGAFKRLFAEFVELEDRLFKLRRYINVCESIDNAELEAECVDMLNAQYNYMLNYLIILRERINYEMKSRCKSFLDDVNAKNVDNVA